ncbi:peptide ABC transporter substrate-binding protein [Terricaulis sp.]|uniref:peptide ABC transporter substrate-binding protein n=1 Tax=Terricaulis sp. TaxID=2768686 RepID=UPI0037850C28
MALWTDRRALLRGVGGLGAAASLAAPLGACANASVVGFDKQKKSLDIANSSEPLSLDPHKVTGTWENNIVGNMFVGLTTEDPQSGIAPGMAERWEVSEDALTWTFFLRRAVWSDGEACDAHDFEFAFRRILDPANMCQYASVLYPIKNAQAVNEGRMRVEHIGVSALDDLTLQIELENPAAYLPALLKHYTAYPVPKHKVTAFGDNWIQPENVVVNGPYTLRKWWSNYIVHVQRNPVFYDAANVELEDLYFYPGSDINAAARKVMAGEAGWSTRFPSNQVGELQRDLPGYVRIAPFLTVNYFSFNLERDTWKDVRVRQALTMAFDRDFVAREIYKTGERAAYSFIPPGVANYPGTAKYRWAELSMEQRLVEAQRLLRLAGYGPNNPLRFEFSHRSSSDNPRVAVAAQWSWRRIADWVNVSLRSVEAQVHYDNLRTKRFDIGDGAWTADFNDAKNYLYLMETRSGSQNFCSYSNPTFDQLVLQSDSERDQGARAQIMVRAEQLMLDEAPVCTSVFLNSTNLVHPDLTGYEDNLEDIHRARWFGIKRS